MPEFYAVKEVGRFVHTSVNSAMPATVRISNRGRDLLGQLAQDTGATMTDVLDAALESYRRQEFLKQANLAYAALADDPVESNAYRAEMASLDGTLGDGLEKYGA